MKKEEQQKPAERRAREEYERQLKEEKILQESLRKVEDEMKKLSGAELEQKQKELQKLEQELKVMADTMRALKEKELREHDFQLQIKEAERKAFAAQAQLEQKERQAYLEQQVALDHAQQELQEQEKLLRAEEARLQAEEKAIQRFIREFYDSGLLEKGKSYRIKLSGSALVINGKPQPAAVHEKFSKLYELLTRRKLDAETPITIVEERRVATIYC